jgi:hypothetical protein
MGWFKNSVVRELGHFWSMGQFFVTSCIRESCYMSFQRVPALQLAWVDSRI